MNEETAFLRAIDLNPDDRVVRLAYADWLDERGDPRAEYLRLSCRLAEVRDGIDPKWRQEVQATELRVRDIRLDSGRSVMLDSLRQFRVYGGLIEGVPTREMNQRIIDRLLAEEQARPFADPPLLLVPEQRPIEYHRERPYPFGEPAALPPIGCVGQFSSNSPARDMTCDCSGLTVIWFQNEFAPPIGHDVWSQFRAMNWEEHAIDGNY